jgi:hypothetical protein
MRRMITGFASGVDDDDAFDDSTFLLKKKSSKAARIASSTMTKYDARGFNEERPDKKLKNLGMSEINEAEEDEHCFDNE